jgi:hypothetical protein
MSLLMCSQCMHAYQIGGESNEIHNLLGMQDTFECITPLCEGRLRKVDENELKVAMDVTELPVRSFFRAIHGFGTGKGEPASLERVRTLLLNKRVVDIKADPVGQPERVIVRQLILEDGTRLHFEVSGLGACIYYIEEPGPSCVEVFDAAVPSERVAESGNTDREEAGRVTDTIQESVPSDRRERLTWIWCTEVGPAAELPKAEPVPSVSYTCDIPAVCIPKGWRPE